MAHTAVHKNILLEDCDNLSFLILIKPACDRSLIPSTDPLVCTMDIITTFIARNIMPLYKNMVLHHFKENTNVLFLIIMYYYYWLNCTCVLYVCVIFYNY